MIMDNKKFKKRGAVIQKNGKRLKDLIIILFRVKEEYGGYQWRYKEDYDPNFDYAIEKPMKNRGRAVVQYDINRNFIGEYEAICKIPDTTLAQKTIINKICNGTGRSKTCKGCLWKWK